MEIGTDTSDRVYVRWAPGGPWTVLDRYGRLTIEITAVTATPWYEDDDARPDGYTEGYSDGHTDGLADGRRTARSAS